MKRSLLLSIGPYIAIFLVWAFFSHFYFIKGLVPYPSSYQVNNFSPWSHYQKYWGKVYNGAMPDVIDQIYPWKYFTIQSYKKGQIPLWNPYNFSGSPHAANFQTAIFSPINVLFFILPFLDAWSISILLQPLIAGISMYLFAQSIKINKIGSFISSIAFMFCGFIVVWMAYGTLSMTVALLPFLLFTVEKYLQSNKSYYLFLMSVSIGVVIFSGHFQMSLYVLTFFALYIFARTFKEKIGKKVIFAMFFVLGILIASVQLLPSIEFYLNSVRSNIFIKGGGIPLSYLITLFSPDFYGNPVTRNDWVGSYAEWASFVGLVPFILCLFPIINKKNFHTKFFLITAIIVLILAIESPVQSVIGALKIPVISTSSPNRIIILLSFCISILAGFGFDMLLRYIHQKETKKILVVFGIAAAVFFIVFLFLFFVKPFSADHLGIAKRNIVLPAILFACVFIGIMINFITKKKVLFFTVFLLTTLVVGDSLRFALKWMPFESAQFVYPHVKIIDALQNSKGIGRVFGNIGTQAETYYGLQSPEGYDPLYIGRYGELVTSSAKGELMDAERSIVVIPRNGKYTDKLLDALGVQTIYHPIADTNQSWAYPVWKNWERYKIVYEDELFQLYKNTQALPRAALFYDYEVKRGKDSIQRFYQPSFDSHKKLLLENSIGNLHIGTGSAQIKSYSPNSVTIATSSTEDALLYLSDNYYPGWKALMDGAEETIYRANYTFRSILVPKGTHTVQFIYDPMSFKIGMLLTAASAIGSFFLMVLLKRNK